MYTCSEIKGILREKGSEERKEKSSIYFSTAMEVLGVSNPDLNLTLKELYPAMKGAPGEVMLALALELVGSRIFEAQIFAWMLLEKAGLVKTLGSTDAAKLEGVLDNWASVDTYGVMIFGVLWRIGTIRDQDVFFLQDSTDRWYRRLALVATVSLNLRSRGGQGDAKRTLAVCRRAVDDHDEMVVKALSWSLRSLILWDREAVERFLEQYNQRLKKRVIREVGHKLEHGTKN